MIIAALSPATGPLLVAAVLLAVAGVAKARRPAPTGLALARLGLPGSDPAVRALGAVEVLAGSAAALLGGAWAAPLVVVYLGFAAVTAAQLRMARRTGAAADCGCFGDLSAPVGVGHVVVNLGLATAAAWATVVSAEGLADAVTDAPAATVAVALLAAVGAVATRAVMTDLPALGAARRALG